MLKLSQETVAIVTVGLTLATLVLTLAGFVISSTSDIRAEARADREAFEKHITRLTQGQSQLTGIVEQMRTAQR